MVKMNSKIKAFLKHVIADVYEFIDDPDIKAQAEKYLVSEEINPDMFKSFVRDVSLRTENGDCRDNELDDLMGPAIHSLFTKGELKKAMADMATIVENIDKQIKEAMALSDAFGIHFAVNTGDDYNSSYYDHNTWLSSSSYCS